VEQTFGQLQEARLATLYDPSELVSLGKEFLRCRCDSDPRVCIGSHGRGMTDSCRIQLDVHL